MQSKNRLMFDCFEGGLFGISLLHEVQTKQTPASLILLPITNDLAC